MIEKGAKVNATDKRGWTSLHIAAQNDTTKTVALLIEKGANVNATIAKDGRTPLAIARAAKHRDVVQLLE